MRRKMLIGMLLALSLIMGLAGSASAYPWDAEEDAEGFTQANGDVWHDVDENVLDSHATSYIKVGDTYYMFGERRIGQVKDTPQMNIFDAFVAYSSQDLVNWKYENVVLDADDIVDDNGDPLSIVGTRTKVIYNDATGQYVMYFKAKRAAGDDRRYGLATSSTVTGPYTFVERSFPTSGDFGDGSLFVDTDGTGYLVYSSLIGGVRHVRIDRLSADYLEVESNVYDFYTSGVWTLKREAPQLFKKDDTYYVTTSGTNGWNDTQGEYTYSTSLNGEWAAPRLFGNSTTYDSQGSDVITVHGTQDTSFIFAADHWDGDNLYNSRIKMFPITFDGGELILRNVSRFRIDVDKGVFTAFDPAAISIENKQFASQLLNAQPDGTNVNLTSASTAGDSALWHPKSDSPDFYFLDNAATGKRLRYTTGVGDIQQSDSGVTGSNVKWKFTDAGDGYYYMIHGNTGMKLAANGSGSDVVMANASDTGDAVKWKVIVDGVADEDENEVEEPAEEEIVEISPLAPLVVDAGTSMAAVPLPAAVTVLLCDDTQREFAVDWDTSSLDLDTVGVYTLQGAVEGTDLPASLTVIVQSASGPEPTETPQLILTGPGAGTAGSGYRATLAIQMPAGVTGSVYGLDITIAYDANDFTFTGTDSVLPGLNVAVQNDTPGTVRLLITSLGDDHGISASAHLLDLLFTASHAPSARSEIAVTRAVLADGDGVETDAAPSSALEVLFVVTDLNGDGKISIGDLAIVGRYYGKLVSEYPAASIADINRDGEVGLADLVLIANEILGQEAD